METRRRNSRVRVASSDQAVGIGVSAPSVVNTQSKAANQAATLSAALGFGQQFAAQQIDIKQRKDAEDGALAAMNGEFTDDELHAMEKSAAFVQGAQKVFAKQRIIEDSAAANEWYQTQFDKGAGLDELRAGLNEFWKDRYEGVSTGIAREITPLMAQTSDNIMTAHASFQSKETHARLIEAQGQILDQAFRGGEYDWSALRKEGNSVIGKDAMNAVAVDAISRRALQTMDETVWDRPEFAMLRKNRQYADVIDKNINDARNARFKANEAATINAQGAATAQIGVLADAGDPSFIKAMELASGPDENGIALVESDTQATALWARYYKAVQAPAEDNLNTTLWAQGDGRAIAKDSDRDEAAMRDATDAVRRAMDADPELPEEDAGALARAYLIERSTINNYLPKQLRAELEISPTHPRFADAVALYDTFEGERKDWVALQIDPDTTRAFQAYKRHLRETGSEEAALERIAARDPSLYSVLSPAELSAASDDIVDVLRDGFLFGDNDINDSHRLRSIVRDDFRYYVESGMPYEMAIAETTKNLKGRYSVVDGELYDVNDGWGADAQSAADLAKEAIALEYGQTGFFTGNPDTDDISIVPVPNKPGFVRIALSGPLQSLGSMTEVPIGEIMDAHGIAVEAAAILAATNADAQADHVAEQKAKAALTPIPNSVSFEAPELYQRMLAERESKWNSLTQSQRDAHMARQRN